MDHSSEQPATGRSGRLAHLNSFVLGRGGNGLVNCVHKHLQSVSCTVDGAAKAVCYLPCARCQSLSIGAPITNRECVAFLDRRCRWSTAFSLVEESIHCD